MTVVGPSWSVVWSGSAGFLKVSTYTLMIWEFDHVSWQAGHRTRAGCSGRGRPAEEDAPPR
ncbi:hypothetical protein ACIF8T_40495, partial [Streptomyces sp. NPDC085946]|uniref:hypothetical protein n=1 Tax=Streptomyces sp. NPDC085946 TaxID=3365744 RepID=UPI0037D5106F